MDGEDIFCICPPRRVLYRKMASNSTISGSNFVDDNKVSLIDAVSAVDSASSSGGGGLSGGAIAGIVIAVVVSHLMNLV